MIKPWSSVDINNTQIRVSTAAHRNTAVRFFKSVFHSFDIYNCKEAIKQGLGMIKYSKLMKSLTTFTFILFIGFMLERLGPQVPLKALKWPVNSIVLSLTIIALFLLQRVHVISTYLSSPTTLISALFLMTVEVIVLGVFPQSHLQKVVEPSLWGIHSVLFSWPWFISHVLLLLILGSHIAKQIISKSFSPLFVLQLGAWIVLIGAQLGHTDIERCWVRIAEGNRADIAFDSERKAMDLGFSISLLDFHMDEYAPKIFLLTPSSEDNSHKRVESQRSCFTGQSDSLGTYKITVSHYHPFAQKRGNNFLPSDSDTGVTVHAAFVTVEKEDRLYSGWISSGTAQIKPHGLLLEDSAALFMDKPQAKSYTSTVIVKDTISLLDTFSIQVNKPVKVKGWKIYQRGYDKERGRQSRITILELIRDPWLPFVYIGIFILIIGALIFLFHGKREELE